MNKVLNLKDIKEKPELYNKDNCVYVGRLPYAQGISRIRGLANPFVISAQLDRSAAIKLFKTKLFLGLAHGEISYKDILSIGDKDLVCHCAPNACHADIIASTLALLRSKRPKFRWSRTGGYEVSSRGDKRFSALYAVFKDGETLEVKYQLDVKGYRAHTDDWRLGKGKPPLNPQSHLDWSYLQLWQDWAKENPELIDELFRLTTDGYMLLSDCFAWNKKKLVNDMYTSPVNQASALSTILNETKLGFYHCHLNQRGDKADFEALKSYLRENDNISYVLINPRQEHSFRAAAICVGNMVPYITSNQLSGKEISI